VNESTAKRQGPLAFGKQNKNGQTVLCRLLQGHIFRYKVQPLQLLPSFN